MVAVGSGDRSGGRVQSLDGGCDGDSEGDSVLGEKPLAGTHRVRRVKAGGGIHGRGQKAGGRSSLKVQEIAVVVIVWR